jgi:hypothetical protein
MNNYFGFISGLQTSSRLLKGTVNWVDTTKCNNLYKNPDGSSARVLPDGIKSTQFCAADSKKEKKVDTCPGNYCEENIFFKINRIKFNYR